MASEEALKILAQVVERQAPRRWHHGTWLGRTWSAEDRAAVEALDPWLGYPQGGRAMLDLPGWDERSIWGYDPPAGCYFAQLWRNRGDEDSPDEPDIWINGWDTVDGKPYELSITRRLAMEIMVATGYDLATVCTALGAYPPS